MGKCSRIGRNMALTNQEKIQVVDGHIKNIEISRYNIELMIKYQQESATPDQDKIDGYQESIASCNSQLSVLLAERAALDV